MGVGTRDLNSLGPHSKQMEVGLHSARVCNSGAGMIWCECGVGSGGLNAPRSMGSCGRDPGGAWAAWFTTWANEEIMRRGLQRVRARLVRSKLRPESLRTRNWVRRWDVDEKP